MVIVSDAKWNQGEVDLSEFFNLNPTPFDQNIEHCHSKSNTTLEIRPWATDNILQMLKITNRHLIGIRDGTRYHPKSDGTILYQIC